jgi:hypothetical protein
MYDEMTNQDFICALAEKAADNPSAEHAAMMDEAARRIRKLENTVIAATAAIESIEDSAYSVETQKANRWSTPSLPLAPTCRL